MSRFEFPYIIHWQCLESTYVINTSGKAEGGNGASLPRIRLYLATIISRLR